MNAMLVNMLIKGLSNEALGGVFLAIAEHFAAKSDNKIDDQLVAAIKVALTAETK